MPHAPRKHSNASRKWNEPVNQKLQIEAWALRVIEAVESNTSIEDAHVELKAEWPKDAYKAARRLAGHANASRGSPILWLIGLDETKGVVGADYLEKSNWFSAISSHFNEVVPDLYDLNMSHLGKNIVLLHFDTARFPYVVKNPNFGKVPGEVIRFEIPWRQGSAVQSATRNDVIKLVAPLPRRARAEVLSGTIRLNQRNENNRIISTLSFHLSAYITPFDDGLFVFPEHQIISRLKTVGANPIDGSCHFYAYGKFEDNIRKLMKSGQSSIRVQTAPDLVECNHSGLILRGPGRIMASGSFNISEQFPCHNNHLELEILLTEALSQVESRLVAPFVRSNSTEPVQWDFQ